MYSFLKQELEAASHGQLVADGHEHLEDGHERRDLAEVAAAHDLRVNLQTLQIAAPVDAAADLVQAAEDAGRELMGGATENVSSNLKP